MGKKECNNADGETPLGDVLSVGHYIMSKTLDKILQEDYISLRASHIKNFWKIEENQQDDSEEFRGALEILNLKKLNLIKNPEKSSDSYELRECVKRLQDMGVTNPIVSTDTPYILCVTDSINDMHLFHKFCNPGNGVPVMLEFDYDLLREDLKSSVLNGNNHPGIYVASRIHYAPKNTLDATSCHGEYQYREAMSLVPEGIQDIFGYSNSIRSDGDRLIDSCLYIKREDYKDEHEIRIIYRKESPFAFGETQGHALATDINENESDRKIQFAFPESEEGDEYEYLKISLKCLKAIAFSSCVSSETMKAVIQLIKNNKNYSHVRVSFPLQAPYNPCKS